ncbi:hypothetical protein Tco_0512738, partial [Tanacetum coccineum]
MIKESVDTAIAAERARHVNARNDARGSGPVMGQDVVPAVLSGAAPVSRAPYRLAPSEMRELSVQL